MYTLLALIALAYAASVAFRGRVTIGDGMDSRLVTRDEAPALIWFHSAVYAALALALASLG